jgi:hypothetical protein
MGRRQGRPNIMPILGRTRCWTPPDPAQEMLHPMSAGLEAGGPREMIHWIVSLGAGEMRKDGL